MTPVLCKRHGKQPSNWVCRHLDRPVHFDEIPPTSRIWLRHVDEVEDLFGYDKLVCERCADALGRLGPVPPLDTLEELEVWMDAEDRVAPIVPACTKCVADFQVRHGPPKPL
jgi:hypothetical protein